MKIVGLYLLAVSALRADAQLKDRKKLLPTTVSVLKQEESSDVITFLDFYSKNCSPCQKVLPIIEKLSQQEVFKGITFRKIERSDPCFDTVRNYVQERYKVSINAFPTFVIFKRGNLIAAWQGYASYDLFYAKLKTILS